MVNSPNSFVWYAICLGVRMTKPDELGWLGPHDPQFKAVLDQSIEVLELLYDGGVQELLGDLENELGDRIEQSTDDDIFKAIDLWLKEALGLHSSPDVVS